MSNLHALNRRHILFGAAGLTGAGLALTSEARLPTRSLDLSDPRVALESYVKLRGSTADETVYQAYEGDIFALINGQMPKLLLGFRGIQKSVWRRDGGDGFHNQDFDVGFYVDHKSRKILDEWANPVTGKIVKVYHYRGGPSGGHFTIGSVGGDVYGGLDGSWTMIGDHLEQRSSFTNSRPNPLNTLEWPLASTGDTLLGAMTTAFVGRVSEVANPRIHQPKTTQIWTNTTSWMPWMEMGKQPGFNEWRWIGAKGIEASDIDPLLVSAVEQVWPGFITQDSRWLVPTSGREDYIRAKRGLPLTR